MTNKLDLLLNSIGKCQPDIADLKPGLTRSAIAKKTVDLPFEFPEELYQLYLSHDEMGEDDRGDINLEEKTPMVFRDRYLSNLDEALKAYCDV